MSELTDEEYIEKTATFYRLVSSKGKAILSPPIEDLITAISLKENHELTVRISEDTHIRCIAGAFEEKKNWLHFVYATNVNRAQVEQEDQKELQDLTDYLGDGKLAYSTYVAFFQNNHLGIVQNTNGPTKNHIERVLKKSLSDEFRKEYGTLRIQSLVNKNSREYLRKLKAASKIEITIIPSPENLELFHKAGFRSLLSRLANGSFADKIRLELEVNEDGEVQEFTDFIKENLQDFQELGKAAPGFKRLNVEGEYEGSMDLLKVNLLEDKFTYRIPFPVKKAPSKTLKRRDVFDILTKKYDEIKEELLKANYLIEK